MIINVTTTTDDFPLKYVSIWQGVLSLTNRDADVLAEIVGRYLELIREGLKEPYLGQLAFSTTSRKDYCTKLGISTYNLQNILGSLKIKGALVGEEEFRLSDKLLPLDNELIFKFNIRDGKKES